MKISIKYFLLFTFLLMEFFSAMAFAGGPEVPPVKSSKAEIKKKPFLTVCITIARRRDCDGFGVCKIAGEWRTASTNSAVANIYMDDLGKNLILDIDKAKGLSIETYNKYFRSGIFIMEDDFPLASETISGLGLSGNKTLISGNHRVSEKEGRIYVTIPVK